MAHSKEYLEELKKLHNIKSFGRNAGIPDVVKNLIIENKINSFLDYGAGKGLTSEAIKEAFPNIDLYTYDPATFPIDLPEKVELTYSSDVLEHVEPSLIDETVNDLSNRSTRYQYHLIACHPAKKSLSDGRNAHLIIENANWWRTKLEALQDWKIVYEDHIDRMAKVKKGPPVHVIKYIVIMEKI